MAKKQSVTYECCKCGESTVDPPYAHKEKWWSMENDGSSYTHTKHLLCSDCYKVFLMWIEEKPVVMPLAMHSSGGPYR